MGKHQVHRRIARRQSDERQSAGTSSSPRTERWIWCAAMPCFFSGGDCPDAAVGHRQIERGAAVVVGVPISVTTRRLSASRRCARRLSLLRPAGLMLLEPGAK